MPAAIKSFPEIIPTANTAKAEKIGTTIASPRAISKIRGAGMATAGLLGAEVDSVGIFGFFR
jgi:hypothetical protein